MSIIQYLEENEKKNLPLSVDLFKKIREDILTGKLKNNEKLTEGRICGEYNVSRTPVREALRQLEASGLIRNIPNRGAFVIGFTLQDVYDMTVLREQAEITAVKWAIDRITDDELDELDETFEFMQFYTRKDDIAKMININMAFHKMIYNATHNDLLIRSLNLYQLYLRHANPSNYYAPDYLGEVLAEHRDIYSCFGSGDPEAGAMAMARHMKNSRRRKFK